MLQRVAAPGVKYSDACSKKISPYSHLVKSRADIRPKRLDQNGKPEEHSAFRVKLANTHTSNASSENAHKTCRSGRKHKRAVGICT